MKPDKYLLWKQSLVEFGRLNNAVPQIVKRPSVGSDIDYYYLSMEVPFGTNKIEFSQGATIFAHYVGFSKVLLSYSYINNCLLTLSLSRSDFFDMFFQGSFIKTGSKDFDKIFSIRSTDKSAALLIFGDREIQELFLGNKLLIFNISTNKSRVTTVTLKVMEEKFYLTSELTHFLEHFKTILHKL